MNIQKIRDLGYDVSVSHLRHAYTVHGYEENLSKSEIIKRNIHLNESYANSVSERANRQSSLTLSPSQYEGQYSNEGYGDFSITVENDTINIRMGLLNSGAYYGEKANTVEVDFSGPGSKQLLEFTIIDNTVESLRFKGLDFVRINQE